MRIRPGSVSWVACRRRDPDADAVADATGEGCEGLRGRCWEKRSAGEERFGDAGPNILLVEGV